MKSEIREAQIKLTDDRICNSFLDLLSEKAIGKITVKDVCGKAGISRGTFYLHYSDIQELIEKINSWYISQAIPFYQMEFDSFGLVNDLNSFRAGVRGHLQILASWPKYAETVFGRDLCPWVFEEIMEICWDQLKRRAEKMGITRDTEANEYAFAYGAYGVQGIMRKWCQDGLNVPVSVITEYIVKAVQQNNPTV